MAHTTANSAVLLIDWQPQIQPDPREFNILLSDVPPHFMPTRVSAALHRPYLSPAPHSRIPSADGCVFGHAMRPFFTLPVSCPERGVEQPLNVHFLFHTGSCYSFLEPRVLDALRLPATRLDSTPVNINGIKVLVDDSDEDKWHSQTQTWVGSGFKGVNLLGMEYLRQACAKLEIRAQSMEVDATHCRLSFPP